MPKSTSKKRRKSPAHRRGLGDAAKVHHLSPQAYAGLLKRHGKGPLARGQCSVIRYGTAGVKRNVTLCHLPTGPVMIIGAK